MSNETLDQFDQNLSTGLDDDDVTLDLEDETDETDEEISSTEPENLDELIKSQQELENKTDSEPNTQVNTTKQINEQGKNKSKGNNNSQDLLDGNGNIIAKAGAERRFYEENVKLKRDRDIFNTQVMPKLRQNYDAMVARVKAYDDAMKSMQAGDLTPEDMQTGFNLIRQWKKSPQDTLKFLLTQAKSYGMTIDGVGGVDAGAINQMLDEKLKPFIQERETRIRQQQIEQQSIQQYNDFIQKYPDAEKHTEELAYLLRKNPNMSLDAVYFMLRNHYSTKGYDFNTPLAEILQQSVNNKVNMNVPHVNPGNNVEKITQKVAPISESYDTIIKNVLKNAKK
jgi:hypothetical protein